MPKPLTGLQRLCRLYGEVRTDGVLWRWDYANEVPVRASEMPLGSARHAASERARWVVTPDTLPDTLQEEV